MTSEMPYSYPIGVELEHLRNMLKSVPYIFEKPTQPEVGEFKFPLGTLFRAPSREIGLSMKDAYAYALREHGIAGIELGFEDPDSQFILDLVEAVGCTPDTHSSTQGALWDVTYKPSGIFSEATGKSAHSISHSLGEFSWHTDGSFEQHPQRFFGFHILHPDKKGGGIFRVLRADDLVKLLSPATVDILTKTTYEIRVPDEFYKGKRFITGKLLEIDPESGHAYVRFRGDILPDNASEDPAANAAVQELKNLLNPSDKVGEYMPDYIFKENTILLMDNARFLHCRSDIKDPRRWLRRVRFHGTPGKSNSS